MNIERVKYLIRMQKKVMLELGEDPDRFREWFRNLPIKEYKEHIEALRVLHQQPIMFGYRLFLEALEDFAIEQGDQARADEARREMFYTTIDPKIQPAPKGPVIEGPGVIVFIDNDSFREIRCIMDGAERRIEHVFPRAISYN